MLGLAVLLLTRGGGKPSPAEIAADAKKRTVLIEAKIPGRASGGVSGFVLDAGKGLVVTNFHVVNGGSEFRVGVDGDLREARVAGAAPCDDLAVLQVADHSGMKTFPLGSQKDLKEGEQVVAVGYPGERVARRRADRDRGRRVGRPELVPRARRPTAPHIRTSCRPTPR